MQTSFSDHEDNEVCFLGCVHTAGERTSAVTASNVYTSPRTNTHPTTNDGTETQCTDLCMYRNAFAEPTNFSNCTVYRHVCKKPHGEGTCMHAIHTCTANPQGTVLESSKATHTFLCKIAKKDPE